MADAAVEILTRPPAACTAQTLIDADVLAWVQETAFGTAHEHAAFLASRLE